MMVDHDSRVKLKSSHCPLELILTWLENLMGVGQDTGVINVAPPILSRAFQTLANGMIAFHDAAKVAETPYPLPYAQTCDLLLLLHWCIAPFTFAQVFVFWSLNLTAREIEDPFGRDANDVDLHSLQNEFILVLSSLLHEDVPIVPRVSLVHNNAHTKSDAIRHAFHQTEARKAHRSLRANTIDAFPAVDVIKIQGHGEVLDAKGRWEAFDG